MKYSNNNCYAGYDILKQHACSLLCSEERRKEKDFSGCVTKLFSIFLGGHSFHVLIPTFIFRELFPTAIIIKNNIELNVKGACLYFE